MNNKILKTLLIIYILVSIMISSIVATHIHHLEVCQNQDCLFCAIIEAAQSIRELILAICIYKITIFLTNYILVNKHKELKNVDINTLIFQKVQFNE